ncbi:MAG: class I SAM-dependent methyltransferase [Flammeovirgaceae bacterium]
MELLTISPWQDYELIDVGGYEKLERFGKYIISRPEPQAVWQKSMRADEWEKISHARFVRNKESQDGKSFEKGEWQLKKGMPEQWWIAYQHQTIKFRMRLGLTSFKHVGVFPEQAVHWNFIEASVLQLRQKGIEMPKVLNLFAYTGGASLAAKASGADVVHLDSVKPVVSWAKENMEGSGLEGIRWVVEDAMKFVKREAKRANQYHGIILDPPAYGRGPQGEKWLLEDHLNELLENCAQILASPPHFLIINLYSMGFSALIVENLIKHHFPKTQSYQFGELYLTDRFKKKLPLGTFLRF